MFFVHLLSFYPRQSLWDHFSSSQSTYFIRCFHKCLLMIKVSFQSENIFITPSFLAESFDEYTILCWQSSSLCIWKTLFNWLLAPIVAVQVCCWLNYCSFVVIALFSLAILFDYFDYCYFYLIIYCCNNLLLFDYFDNNLSLWCAWMCISS